MWFKQRNARPTAADVARRLVIFKQVVATAGLDPAGERVCPEVEAQREQAWRTVRDAGLWTYLSAWEQALAESDLRTLTPQQRVYAQWRLEAAQVLLWALGLLPEVLPYDTRAHPDLLALIPANEAAAFIRAARLRSEAELQRAREVAELWHWRSRTRTIMERGAALPVDDKMVEAGFQSYDDLVRFSVRQRVQAGTLAACIAEDLPAKGKAYRDLNAAEWAEISAITAERHFTLRWLAGRAPDNRWDESPIHL